MCILKFSMVIQSSFLVLNPFGVIFKLLFYSTGLRYTLHISRGYTLNTVQNKSDMKIIQGIRKEGRREKDMNYRGISKGEVTFTTFFLKCDTRSVATGWKLRTIRAMAVPQPHLRCASPKRCQTYLNSVFARKLAHLWQRFAMARYIGNAISSPG